MMGAQRKEIKMRGDGGYGPSAKSARKALAAKISAASNYAQAQADREAALLWDAETNDRAVRAMEGVKRDFYAFGDIGDDYDEPYYGEE
jgi:hypothetical protein